MNRPPHEATTKIDARNVRRFANSEALTSCMDPELSSSGAPSPASPRYQTFRRVAWLALGVIFWNMALWGCWYAEAERRLRGFIAERRALNEPTRVDEFPVRRTKQDQRTAARLNSALKRARFQEVYGALHQAMVIYSVEGVETHLKLTQKMLDDPGTPPIIRELQSLLREPLSDEGPLPDSSVAVLLNRLRHIGTAMIHTHLTLATGVLGAISQAYEDQEKIDEAMASAAATLAIVRHANLLAHPANQTIPTWSACARAASRVARLALDHGLPRCENPQFDVDAVISCLAKDADFRQAVARRFWSRRAVCLERGQLPLLHDGDVRAWGLFSPNREWTWIYTPLFELEALAEAKNLSREAAAALAGRFDHSPPIGFVRVARCDLPPFGAVPALYRKFLTVDHNEFVYLAELRMAAIVLAMRAFERDHGCLPPALSDLVPAYMPTLPQDPFAAPDHSLGYLPNADPPRIFSVGLTGAFDGAPYVVWLPIPPDCASRRIEDVRAAFPGNEHIVLIRPLAESAGPYDPSK